MKYLLSLFVFSSFSLIVSAQVKPRALRADIKTPHATCADCKPIIESFVSKSIDGLVKITVQPTRGITQVQYYPDRTHIEEIKTAISNAGFDADDVMANPDTYANLPDCCKKPGDQKKPPKPKS
jgi:copper chaperone CopZ